MKFSAAWAARGAHFAYQRLPGLPDIVVVAKAASAADCRWERSLAREEFAAAFSPGLHGSTFGGGPLTSAPLA
jgi:acetylornithine/N-succinyldiaminopimelate aminotransferase